MNGDDEGLALAEDVDDIEEPGEVNPYYGPRYPSFCRRCDSGCYRRLNECRLYPDGYPGYGQPGYGQQRCRRQFRFCIDRCEAMCRRY